MVTFRRGQEEKEEEEIQEEEGRAD